MNSYPFFGKTASSFLFIFADERPSPPFFMFIMTITGHYVFSSTRLWKHRESEEKSSFQPLPLIVFEAHVLFHKTGERYALFEAHPFSLSYFLFALEWIRHFSFYIGGNVVLMEGILEGWTFGGLNENADICAWIEMWFLHLELLITILLYGDIFKS